MALALSFDEAKTEQLKIKGSSSKGGATLTRFFGARDNPDLPSAHLCQRDPGRTSVPHFHIVDQFQVIVDGKGKIGRHDLYPYGVHFSRAYTPYGPLSSDADSGLSFLVMRTHPDPGSQRLPAAADKLKLVPDRQPWQITRSVTFPKQKLGTADIVLEAVPDMTDENGLAAYTLRMKPDTTTHAPDPSHGDGQYLIVCNGSVLHDNKEHNALALVFVYPKEDAFLIHAGSRGLEAMVLNFPRAKAHTVAATSFPVTGVKTW